MSKFKEANKRMLADFKSSNFSITRQQIIRGLRNFAIIVGAIVSIVAPMFAAGYFIITHGINPNSASAVLLLCSSLVIGMVGMAYLMQLGATYDILDREEDERGQV